MLIDPTSTYARAAAAAMSRAIDDELIAAATGSAKTGKSGSSSTALPAGQQIANGSANLTLAKLLVAKQIMDSSDVDEDNRHIVISPKGLQNLLNVTEVKSADYNSVNTLPI